MTTRTRARTDKVEQPAADEQPTTEQPVEPADEAQAERATPTVEEAKAAAEQFGRDLAESRGQIERHNALVSKFDGLATRLDTIAGVLDRAAAAPDPEVDLTEIHDRFDVLSAEIGGGMIRPEAAVESPVPAVLGQVLALMRAVREIGKGGTAPQQVGGYRFRKVDDAIDAVGNACRDVGLVLRSEVVRLDTAAPNGGMRTAHAIMRYTFVSTIDGTEHAIEGAGEGADKGDKSTSKACSMALKYALLQGLMIPVVGVHLDVEAEDTRPEPPQRQQRDERPRDRATEAQRDAYHRGEQMPDAAPQQQHDPSNEPPEVRAAEVLRRANDGRDAAAIRVLLGKATDAGLAGVEIESYGHRDTLQNHVLAVIRLAQGGRS